MKDPALKGVPHVIVDEVLERQWQIDVLLVSLRKLLQGPRPDLKVVLVRTIIKTSCLLSLAHPHTSLVIDVRYA